VNISQIKLRSEKFDDDDDDDDDDDNNNNNNNNNLKKKVAILNTRRTVRTFLAEY
jgi:hypothetical protein